MNRSRHVVSSAKSILSCLLLASCFTSPVWAAKDDATETTKAANKAVLDALPFNDTQDFKDADKGFIAPLPNNGVIKMDDGTPIWDISQFNFVIDKDAPETTNPSLWRQLQLLAKSGLYEVAPKIYQVRGNDLTNLTFIEGDKGVAIVDPNISAEAAKYGLDLYREHRGDKPVVAVIYTHSHIDHFGGVRGVVDEADVKSGKVKIVAPEGFVEEAVSENVFAGNAMTRRAGYMYGNLIEKGPKGGLGTGLGLSTSTGTPTLIEPTDIISSDDQTLEIDGLTYEFMMAPGSEAPAEMLFYIPQLKALCPAEDVNHTMHNLYSLRGAKVRDAKRWSSYIHAVIGRWGNDADVMFAPHHWPTWGNDNIVDQLKKQRDLYKYTNDQTLRLANQGYNMVEAAEMVKLPPELANYWGNRGYYGSLNHNVKAVWNFYLGWFDGNPSRLHPLPSAEAGKKFVEYMGGADAIMSKAQKDFDAGNYRWVAQVLDKLVSAQPDNQKAKNMLADALVQMGYQSENGPWRNFYLSGAKELRDGVKELPMPNTSSPDIVSSMSTEMFLDFLAIHVDGDKAAGKKIYINMTMADMDKTYGVTLENGVLNYYTAALDDADLTINITREEFNDIILGAASLKDKVKSGDATLEGDESKFDELMSVMVTFDPWWPIMTPKEAKM
ncbi:alkyl/aryl-sulfatase [Marinobacter sp. 1Y8]